MTSRTALPTNPFRAPERALAAKTRLDEFEIERVLAQSSFAVVYRAYDHALKLHVAIKEYLPDALALRSAETQVVLRARSHAERFELGLQAFIDEAQTLARCDHPALLRVARILQRHGTAYRVMRYSPGPTLLAHRRELAATPDAQALRSWLEALLDALDTLHEEGCVHGAVAPGNILLLPGGRPMLLDFDAVRAALISDRTQSMMTALEPCFEPIEQRAPTGESAMGPWTDLYALAATLHFCISGQLPAPPSGAAAQTFEPLAPVWQRLRGAQPRLGEAPPWLGALAACLRDVPAQRPQNVAQLRGLLGGTTAVVSCSPLEQPAPYNHVPMQPRSEVAPPRRSDASPPRAGNTLPPPRSRAALPSQLLMDLPAARPANVPPVPARPAPAAVPGSTKPAAASPPRPGADGLAPKPAAMDASHARVIADLDKTFAYIAAQANEDAAPKAGAPPNHAKASPPGAKPLTRMQLGLVVAVIVLILGAMGALVSGLLQVHQPGLVSGGAGTESMKALAVPGKVPQPQAALGNSAGSLDPIPTAAGTTHRASASPAPPRPAAAAAKAKPPTTSPREACGERTRFALYQCMQTQCTKPAWTKHAQCVRLRKEQKLG